MTHQYKCDNCEKLYDSVNDFTPLEEVHHLNERLDPGSEVPAGECKECGAFVYIHPPKLERGHLPAISQQLLKALQLQILSTMRDGTPCSCPLAKDEDDPTIRPAEMPTKHAIHCEAMRAALAKAEGRK